MFDNAYYCILSKPNHNAGKLNKSKEPAGKLIVAGSDSTELLIPMDASHWIWVGYNILHPHEPILFGWKKSGKHAWYSDRKQSTIWEFDKPRKNTEHPTQKPVPLVAYPILNSSMTGCVVLDPFGGSGSTLIACEQTERVCYTVELDEKFCDVIVKRYYQYSLEHKNSEDPVSDIFVIRNGQKLMYNELKKEMES